jgi:FkbM family methyltransferase
MTPQGHVTLAGGALTQGISERGGRLARTVIDRSPVVRSVIKSAPAQRQIVTGRALTVVRERARFVARELEGRTTGRYRLRDSGLTVHVRHRTGDVVILNKIFTRGDALNSYQPPAEVAAALDALAAPRILDVGANIGLFGVFALGRWPEARITAFEPDPSNRHVLCQTVAANDDGRRWTVVAAAVANAVGELSFVPDLGAEAHIARTHEDGTVTVPTVDFYEQLGDGADLVKMDCEGGEWAILADPRFAAMKAGIIRLEWHSIHCPQPDARAEAIRLLRAGGFTQIVDADHEHDRNGVLWAWRERSA